MMKVDDEIRYLDDTPVLCDDLDDDTPMTPKQREKLRCWVKGLPFTLPPSVDSSYGESIAQEENSRV